MPEGLSHLTMDNVQVYFQRMEGVFVYNFCHWKYYYVLINYRFCFLSLHYTVITLTPFEHLDFPFPLNSLSSWILVWFDLYANIHYRGFQNLSQVNVRLFFKIPIDHEPSWFTCPLCAQSCAYSMTREIGFFCKVLLQIRAHLCSKAFLGSFSPFYMEHPIIKLLTKRIILNFLWNLSDLKSDFTLTLGYLNPALNNPALNNFLPRAFCLSSTVWLLNLVAGSEIQTKDVLKPKFH